MSVHVVYGRCTRVYGDWPGSVHARRAGRSGRPDNKTTHQSAAAVGPNPAECVLYIVILECY